MITQRLRDACSAEDNKQDDRDCQEEQQRGAEERRARGCDGGAGPSSALQVRYGFAGAGTCVCVCGIDVCGIGACGAGDPGCAGLTGAAEPAGAGS